ncbi:MAG: nucleotide exchange factor GrpE [Alphaproteobacteria bacterium CG_4_9_14_3_um_filter_47_13]|nr:MAG: nucleotide exchange factor GrpE [Alphaproteobacteria bacterium CG_4_9_14_3_um_filter_47_13]
MNQNYNNPENNETPEQQEHDSLAPEPEGDSVDQDADENNRLAAIENELADAKDQLLRALAETDNTRKRLLREREDIRKYAVSDFARDMLGFSDNFRRALDSLPKDFIDTDERIDSIFTGLEAMEKELLKTLGKHGIKKIEPLDEPFDPNFHEALFETPGTGKAAGTIIQIIEPGYVLHNRLLRPARVGVAKNEGTGSPEHRIDQEI